MAPHTRVQNWDAITLHEEDSFATALEFMNRGGYQLALVRRFDGLLAGMVTDSDIRKALLRGITLERPVSEVMNASPLVVSPELGEAEAHQLMLLNHFFHLPVVDASGQLVGLHVAEQLRSPVEHSETMVIMAGGRGKRLMPLTATIPKPMLLLQDRPILEHIIERVRLEGFRQVVISVNYLSEVIIQHFGDGSAHGVSIHYLQEHEPLGTAGALASLDSSLRLGPVVVTNADVITNVAYGDLLSHARHEAADGLMAVRMQEWQNPFGVVLCDGNRLLGLEEKPVHRHQVNAGMYVLSPALLDLLQPYTYCDMTDLFSRGIKHGLNLRVFPLHESWLDIGRHADYKRATTETNTTDNALYFETRDGRFSSS
jgi:dTDP-glucose pyrophosphorylase/predicted transcriptional regulator